MYHAIATRWTPDYHKKAEPIQMSNATCSISSSALSSVISIDCEVSNQPERQLHWLRCAMLAQDELRRRSEGAAHLKPTARCS